MKTKNLSQWQKSGIWVVFSCFVILLLPPSGMAKDTDIYNVTAKQNCYILMDNSSSMGFGVYEQSVDYGAMYDYLFMLHESAAPWDSYIYDTITNNAFFYINHKTRRRIYLFKGAVGLTIANNIAFTGDSADPDYGWDYFGLVDTYTDIDQNGNLSASGGGTQRITVDSDGYVLLDGQRLPIGQDIKLHDLQTLYDGSQIDRGFGGLLNAPGYYFSGYEGVLPGFLDVAETGDQNIYFFLI